MDSLFPKTGTNARYTLWGKKKSRVNYTRIRLFGLGLLEGISHGRICSKKNSRQVVGRTDKRASKKTDREAYKTDTEKDGQADIHTNRRTDRSKMS